MEVIADNRVGRHGVTEPDRIIGTQVFQGWPSEARAGSNSLRRYGVAPPRREFLRRLQDVGIPWRQP